MKYCLIFCMYFLLIFQAYSANAAKHALLIGIDDYRNTGLKSLQGPENDLSIITHVLHSRYGFSKENINTLINERATHCAIEKAFCELAGKIMPEDFVYIHYSGHGSLTPDLNGDERSGYDQTWVPFGSRVKGITGKDGYDILDDELNEWLIPVFEKTEHVVFVSDSCNSSSITRGESPAIRAGSVDGREHPLGRKIFKSRKFLTGIRISASKDNEPAAEFRFDDGKDYGLFTWHWAKALKQAWPGETWRDLYQRTFTMVVNRSPSQQPQQPQFQGKGNLAVFGEDGRKHRNNISDRKMLGGRVTVSHVYCGGKMAKIEAGFLSNVTAGSVYRLFNPSEKNKDKLPSIKITGVTPFDSIGEISGSIGMGDLIVEEEHAYDMKPMPIFINADDPEGEDLESIRLIRSMFLANALSEYKITGKQNESMMVLYVLRPKKINGKYVKTKPEDTLPKSFPGHSPEVWILTYVERVLHKSLRIPFEDAEKGPALLSANLKKIAKIHEIKKLASVRPPDFELTTTAWQPVGYCEKSNDDCLVSPDGKSFFKKMGQYNCEEMIRCSGGKKPFELNTLLTFSVQNNSERTFYAYILRAMANGEIQSVFPTMDDRREDALINPGEKRDFKKFSALLLNDPGEELIKLIVSERPINIALLHQNEFDEKRAPNNPLEQLLTNALYGRRDSTVNVRVDNWGTMQYSFVVK